MFFDGSPGSAFVEELGFQNSLKEAKKRLDGFKDRLVWSSAELALLTTIDSDATTTAARKTALTILLIGPMNTRALLMIGKG
jgi:hypothetical protein